MLNKNKLEMGHYFRKQIGSRSWLISWSHASRFRVAMELAKPFAGLRLLDYGCGDGTFLGMLVAQPYRPAFCVGADLDDGQVDDCNNRFSSENALHFSRIDSLRSESDIKSFDAIFCMEVMEHVVDLEPLFNDWKEMAKAGAAIIVSVPVETGIALVVKQVARLIAGWRGIGDYPGSTPYTWFEFAKSIFAGKRQHIYRPVHGAERGTPGYCHKGFNWKWLEGELRKHFKVERVQSSPLTWLPAGLGSQVWFVLRA